MTYSETASTLPVVEEAFPVAKGRIRLFRCVHLPETVQGVVLLTHGLGEHSARYGHVIHALTSANVAVVRYDLRGHGRSDGPRGHAPGFKMLLDDLSMMFAWTRERFPQIPTFLYGHSLGGNITANWGLRRPAESRHASGAILSSPWFRLAKAPAPLKVTAIRILGTVWPNLPIPAGFRPKRLMRNQEAINAYNNDPLIHRRVSARLVAQAFDAGEWAFKRASEFPLPSLCLHGGADSITSPEATAQFSAAAPDSKMLLFPELVHEPHNEPEWKEVVTEIRDWVLTRIKTPAHSSQSVPVS